MSIRNSPDQESSTLQKIYKLLYPGIGIKRWLILGAAGITICALGVAYFIRRIFLVTFPDFLPSHLEGALLLAAGTITLFVSLYGLYKALSPLLTSEVHINSIGETLYDRLAQERGPRIVAIGGGTGLSVLLRGLKQYTNNLTAVISVADDGGSSGRLRRELGVLPPGDFRNCIVAMSDEQSLLPELFQYRFKEGNALKGHSFGNLFIVAMSYVADNFVEALSESSRVLAVRGTINPATTENLRLSAEMEDGSVIKGESRITEHRGKVKEIAIEPPDAEAYQPAVQAIMDADIVVLGPGSLYTSILPNLMVPGINKAMNQTKATTVYVCNVATEIGETQGFNVADHVITLQNHTDNHIVEWVLVNNNIVDIGDRFEGDNVMISIDKVPYAKIASSDLIDINHPVRHDSQKLAQLIMDIYHSRIN